MSAINSESPDRRLVWLDLETFGLDSKGDPIIEIGIIITDAMLETVDSESWLVWQPTVYGRRMAQLERAAESGDKGSKIVLEMHSSSGLFEDAASFGKHPHEVEASVCRWLKDREVEGKDPLVGSSVHFDRGVLQEQMPEVLDHFSHRNIDVSSLTELGKRVNPTMIATIGEDLKPSKTHRALDDLNDSIALLLWHLDNFVYVDSNYSILSRTGEK